MATHTFITRTLSRRANTRMLVFLIGSALVLCLAVALVPPVLRELMAWVLAIVPAAGYVLLSWLYEREQTYEVSPQGLKVVSEPAHQDFTLIEAQAWDYTWAQITDFAEGDTLVLGHYGYLEIGVQESEAQSRTLRLTPGRRSEVEVFEEFAEAFSAEVAALNQDDTPRAVAVATIHRRTSLYEHPLARPVVIVLAVLVAGLYALDLFTAFDEPTEWRLAYLYLLLFPLVFYGLRRSFATRAAV